MRVKRLGVERVQEFINYCKNHREEHDPSYLDNEELENFKLNDYNPTYVLLDEKDKIIGCVSLMIAPEMGAKRGRFRIFHSVETDISPYKLMLEEILPYTKELKSVYLFIPRQRTAVREILELLEFRIRRISYILEVNSDDMVSPKFSQEYEIRPLKYGNEEDMYCNIVNKCLSVLPDYCDITSEQVKKEKTSSLFGHIGHRLLWKDNKPIGAICVTTDDEDGIEEAGISNLAILPEYRGLGLGKNLLRAGVNFAKEIGIEKIWLCVNGENEKAARLYLSEGFKEVSGLICYTRYNIG